MYVSVYVWMDGCMLEGILFIASNHKLNVNHHCQVGQGLNWSCLEMRLAKKFRTCLALLLCKAQALSMATCAVVDPA